MSLKQDILLYSDATFFDDLRIGRNLACGAAIIRSENAIQENQIHKKFIRFFVAVNPSQAEIETGTLFTRFITSHFHTTRIKWYCDLPYLEDLITKDSIQSSFSSISEDIFYLKEMHQKSILSFHTPKTSSQIKYHTLCHRACRMSRKLISELNLENQSTEEINKKIAPFLENKKSQWKTLGGSW